MHNHGFAKSNCHDSLRVDIGYTRCRFLHFFDMKARLIFVFALLLLFVSFEEQILEILSDPAVIDLCFRVTIACGRHSGLVINAIIFGTFLIGRVRIIYLSLAFLVITNSLVLASSFLFRNNLKFNVHLITLLSCRVSKLQNKLVGANIGIGSGVPCSF